VQTHLRPETVEKLRQTLASYQGHFRHANAYNLAHAIFTKTGFLKQVFSLEEGFRLLPANLPPFEPTGLKEQYRWFTVKFKGLCLFFQVGRFCEFHGVLAHRYAGLFGLKPGPGRRGMGLRAGFHVRSLKAFKRKAMLAGISYAVVAETGFYPSGLKKRAVTEVLLFGGEQ